MTNACQARLLVCQRRINAAAHLSQVDVDGVLQEVGRLSGPLLDGQHPDGLDAGLQLDHTGVLVLQEGVEEGGWRPSAGLIVSMGPQPTLRSHLHNQRGCLTFLTTNIPAQHSEICSATCAVRHRQVSSSADFFVLTNIITKFY